LKGKKKIWASNYLYTPKPTYRKMPRFQPKCSAFLKSNPGQLCACAGKYEVGSGFFCGTHKKSAEKAGEARVAEIAQQHTEKPDCVLCEEECPICYENIDSLGEQMTLECGHAFHKKCGAAWLSSKESCPMCRAAVQVPKAKDAILEGYLQAFASLAIVDARLEAVARPRMEKLKRAFLAGATPSVQWEIVEETLEAFRATAASLRARA